MAASDDKPPPPPRAPAQLHATRHIIGPKTETAACSFPPACLPSSLDSSSSDSCPSCPKEDGEGGNMGHREGGGRSFEWAGRGKNEFCRRCSLSDRCKAAFLPVRAWCVRGRGPPSISLRTIASQETSTVSTFRQLHTATQGSDAHAYASSSGSSSSDSCPSYPKEGGGAWVTERVVCMRTHLTGGQGWWCQRVCMQRGYGAGIGQHGQ